MSRRKTIFSTFDNIAEKIYAVWIECLQSALHTQKIDKRMNEKNSDSNSNSSNTKSSSCFYISLAFYVHIGARHQHQR